MSGSGVVTEEEVVDQSRAGPRRHRPLEAGATNSAEGEDHQQGSSQAAEARQQTAAPAKAVVKLSSSQPESPSISTSTIIASSSSWSSPTSRPPRTRRSVPGFPQRVAAPARHDTTTIAAVAAKSSSIDCWPTSGGAASTEPEPALLQFSEATSEPIAVVQAELPEQVLEKADSGDVLVGSGVGAAEQDQDILLGGDLPTGGPPQGAGEVMATTSSLTR